ncbi:MAG: hypothetical protein CME20_13955, partial [Gemmatimonadetes bacterium]|nr:hypothetical protein [Gemmatimonadota bacterium]
VEMEGGYIIVGALGDDGVDLVERGIDKVILVGARRIFLHAEKHVYLAAGQVFLQPFEWRKYARWRADTQLALALDLAQNFEAETAERIVFDGVFREAFLVLGYQVESADSAVAASSGAGIAQAVRTRAQRAQ